LTLHFVSSFAEIPSIDADLVQQPGDQWAGHVHREWFDSQVILHRPAVHGAISTSPILGTWSESSGPDCACMHIVEVAPSEFAGWSDSLMTFGSVKVAPRVARPAAALQRYGELMKVRAEGSERFSFELYAYSPMCCSHTVVGLPEAHGDRIEGAWPSGPNQSGHQGYWTKMPGDSCITGQNLTQ
jgi:hypothetical protein